MNWLNPPVSYFEPFGYEIEFILKEEQISENLKGYLYGGFTEVNDGVYFDKVYKVKGLSDKYILDSNSEAIDDKEIEWIYEELSEYGIDQSNSIILTNNVKITKYDNLIPFPFIFFRWISFIKLQNFFPYVPYSTCGCSQVYIVP